MHILYTLRTLEKYLDAPSMSNYRMNSRSKFELVPW